MGDFRPGDPHSGYYSDLRGAALRYGRTAREVAAAVTPLTAVRRTANPVSIAQVGLGAWQLRSEDPGWRDVVARVVDWLLETADEHGRIAYLFPMPHTYTLRPPWCSAMAQAEAASLLVRAARTLGDPELSVAAARTARPLVEPRFGLITETNEGPVLQEYPTSPPSHVLNGWITALWGLYDVSHRDTNDDAEASSERSYQSFVAGVEALSARLALYRIGRGWSRYDLFPHPLPNVASPFYHRLHVEQLGATDRLEPRNEFQRTRALWQAALGKPFTVGGAVAAKVAFRVTRPRSRRIPVPWNVRDT